jgi:small subunit ribosomal protein S17
MAEVIKKSASVLEGVVTSDKMNKTRVVEVTKVFQHSEYKKVIARQIKCYAHDEKNVSKIGDKVYIVETGPVSKSKRWRITKVVAA